MESQQYTRLLNLIIYLTASGRHTAQQYADMLGVTRRCVYNYLQLLADYGFRVVRDAGCYSLDPRSPFFKRLKDNIPLSDTEAEYLCHTLAEADPKDAMAARLRAKLARHFGLDDIADTQRYAEHINTCKATLRQAMKEERIAKITGYSSPHSHTVSDRYVEPYLFMNNGRDVRCHEIATHTNKTFKLARMGGVELLDDSWFNKQRHRQVYTDIFMFSGEERHTVTLRLGQLAHNLLVEEYPLAEQHVTPLPDGRHWTAAIDVASFLGIGRFVIGLYDDIDILGDEAFAEYIGNKVAAMKASIHQAAAHGGDSPICRPD